MNLQKLGAAVVMWAILGAMAALVIMAALWVFNLGIAALDVVAIAGLAVLLGGIMGAIGDSRARRKAGR